MHNAIAHHQLNDTQTVPEQQSPPPSHVPPVYILTMMFYGVEYPFGSLRSAVLPPTFLCTCLLAEHGKLEHA